MDTFMLISLKENTTKSDLINEKLTINSLQNLQNLILYKVSNRILDNVIHKGNSIILSNTELTKFNIFNYKLSKTQNIIPIFNITYNNLMIYLEQYKFITPTKQKFHISIICLFIESLNCCKFHVLFSGGWPQVILPSGHVDFLCLTGPALLWCYF